MFAAFKNSARWVLEMMTAQGLLVAREGEVLYDEVCRHGEAATELVAVKVMRTGNI